MSHLDTITLSYPGKKEPVTILDEISPSPLNPVQTFEPNQLYHGDNLGTLKALLADYRAQVKLVYLDPPFATGRTFRNRGVEVYRDEVIGSEYLEFLNQRLVFCKELLADNGTLYVHLCPKMAPYVRILLDELFGRKPYHRTIIWKRTGAHANAHSYGNVHDVILFYPKTRGFQFKPDYQPYPKNEIHKRFPHVDANGRRFAAGDLAGESLKTAHDPAYRYDWNGHHRIWRCPRQTMERWSQEGRIYYSRTGLPRKQRFQDEQVLLRGWFY